MANLKYTDINFFVSNIGNDAIVANPILPKITQGRAFEGATNGARVIKISHSVIQETKNPPDGLTVNFL